jgi:hypothetical protein
MWITNIWGRLVREVHFAVAILLLQPMHAIILSLFCVQAT